MAITGGGSEREGAMNVLVTSAGRRTSLVLAFAEEVHARSGRVYAADVDALAPALALADGAVRTPRVDDPGYVDSLLEAVARHGIALLVPTIDTDLPVLARSTSSFADLGCRVAISSEDFIAVTRDKHRTAEAFGEAGIRVPRCWLPPVEDVGALPDRLFVKPRAGSASLDTYAVVREQLGNVLRLVRDPVIQEALTGPEITVDALLDFEGTPIHFVPRRRIRTVGGESIQGVTLDHDPALEAWIGDVLRTASGLGARGPQTLQLFLTPDGPTLTEINARFGGGFPLGRAAGAAYPGWLLDMVEGRAVAPRLGDYEAGVYMTRYYVELFTRTTRW